VGSSPVGPISSCNHFRNIRKNQRYKERFRKSKKRVMKVMSALHDNLKSSKDGNPKEDREN